MRNEPIKETKLASAIPQEEILVIRREHLFKTGVWQGLQRDGIDSMVQLIEQHGEFQERSCMENDPTYKQIIPYLIYTHQHRYFLMQRKASASEQRLKNKMCLGIGGHMRQSDMQGKSLFDWARREFHEEVAYQGRFTVEPLGLLNDDSNSVGQVHLGLVLLVTGDSASIAVKSELKQGKLANLSECLAVYDDLEPWSQLVIDLLQKREIKGF